MQQREGSAKVHSGYHLVDTSTGTVPVLSQEQVIEEHAATVGVQTVTLAQARRDPPFDVAAALGVAAAGNAAAASNAAVAGRSPARGAASIIARHVHWGVSGAVVPFDGDFRKRW